MKVLISLMVVGLIGVSCAKRTKVELKEKEVVKTKTVTQVEQVFPGDEYIATLVERVETHGNVVIEYNENYQLYLDENSIAEAATLEDRFSEARRPFCHHYQELIGYHSAESGNMSDEQDNLIFDVIDQYEGFHDEYCLGSS